MEISGKTKLYALIGSPTAHSQSPVIYNFLFEQEGIDARYLAFDVKPEHVAISMLAMKTMGIAGMNVTYPHKQAVLPFMQWVSPTAKLVGAVNNIVNRNGDLYGYMTDGAGYIADLRAHGVSTEGARFLIAGAGGAATAIIAQAAQEGFEEIWVLKRKNESYAACVEQMAQIEQRAAELGGGKTRIRVYDSGERELFQALLKRADIFCNASNVGMAPRTEESLVEDAAWLRPELIVSDIIYHPLQTRLMQQAESAGCRMVLGGRGMLLHQALENFRLMTGIEPRPEGLIAFFEKN